MAEKVQPHLSFVGVGLPCLSLVSNPVCDRIPRRSLGKKSVRFRKFKITSLRFADYVFLLASSAPQALGQFAVECAVVGLRVSPSESEAMVLCRKMVEW